jgi:hypothetical protein
VSVRASIYTRGGGKWDMGGIREESQICYTPYDHDNPSMALSPPGMRTLNYPSNVSNAENAIMMCSLPRPPLHAPAASPARHVKCMILRLLGSKD